MIASLKLGFASLGFHTKPYLTRVIMIEESLFKRYKTLRDNFIFWKESLCLIILPPNN